MPGVPNLITSITLVLLVGCAGNNAGVAQRTGDSSIILDQNTDPRFSMTLRGGTIGVVQPAGEQVYLNRSNMRNPTELDNAGFVHTETNSSARIVFFADREQRCEIKVTEFRRGRLYGDTEVCRHELTTAHSVSQASRGLTEYHLEVMSGATTITVFQGSVRAWAAGNLSQAVVVDSGSESTITRSSVEKPRQLSQKQLSERVRWLNRYDYKTGSEGGQGIGTAGKLLLGIGAVILGKKIYDEIKDDRDDDNDGRDEPSPRQDEPEADSSGSSNIE